MPALNPPNTPLIDERGNIRPEWYRYLVQAKGQSDAFAEASIVTITDATNAFPSARILEAAPGELTATDTGASFVLGLADTAVAAGGYGSEAKTLSITVDAKGRLTGVESYDLLTDNVAEGTVNLYFTETRAREVLSAGDGISYDNTTGVIALDAATADFSGLPVYADNAAATAGGLGVGLLYRTATGALMVRY